MCERLEFKVRELKIRPPKRREKQEQEATLEARQAQKQNLRIIGQSNLMYDGLSSQ